MLRLLLILDDDRIRLRGFDEIVSRLGKDWKIKAWRDALTMAAEIDQILGEAQLISLDHDLYKDSPSDPDPGSGRMIADLLSKRDPVCPVILHSTNTDAAWGMFNELTSAKWNVELVHHLNQPAWIEQSWLPVAMKLTLAGGRKTTVFPFRLDEGLVLEQSGELLPWGASMKALKQIGSPVVAQYGTMIFWKDTPILGGLIATIMRTNRGQEIFSIVPDFSKTAEEQYRITLDALTDRLGRPHSDEPGHNPPWVLWLYDYVVLSLQIDVNTLGESKCLFEIHKRR